MSMSAISCYGRNSVLEQIHTTSNVHIQLEHAGKIVVDFWKSNITTTIGKEIAAKLLGGLTTRTFNYVQIGTGAVAAVVGDTTLGAFYKEKLGATTFVSPNILNIIAVIDITSTISLTETGLFDDILANSPDLLARVVFTTVAASSGDKFYVTWQVSVA